VTERKQKKKRGPGKKSEGENGSKSLCEVRRRGQVTGGRTAEKVEEEAYGRHLRGFIKKEEVTGEEKARKEGKRIAKQERKVTIQMFGKKEELTVQRSTACTRRAEKEVSR